MEEGQRGRHTHGGEGVDRKGESGLATLPRVADTDEPEADGGTADDGTADDADSDADAAAAANGEMDDDAASDAVEETGG